MTNEKDTKPRKVHVPVADAKAYLKTRKTLVKALHTRTTVARFAVFIIQSDSFPQKTARAAVNRALQIIGQGGDWADDDKVYNQCVASTEAILRSGEKV